MDESIATERHRLKGQALHSSGSPEIKLLDFLYGEWGVIRDILQFRGYTTLEAETGEAGVTLARERLPALILMDVQLPGMDGREATKALKADPSTQKIPVIAMTAFAMKGDKESLLADGFDGYMSKPIIPKRFPSS